MKRIAFISAVLSALLMAVLLHSCEEERVGQTPTNRTPPSPLTNVVIEPTYGGAFVTYSLPNEVDISHVRCEFVFNNRKRNVLSSVFNNSLEIEGISQEIPIELKLTVVNGSGIESVPHIETFTPLEPPMSFILNSFRVYEAFGGVTVTWENPTRMLAGISFLATNDDGEFELQDIVYSTLPTGVKSLRGFNTDRRTFAISITDRFENESDTVKFEREPWYEAMLDKSNFLRVSLTGDNNTSHDNRPIEHIWNGILHGAHYEIWHTVADAGFIPPQTFTIDVGTLAQLTRIVVYNRSGDNDMYAYGQHNLRSFDIWGSDNLQHFTQSGQHQVSTDPYWNDGSWRQDWHLLAECEIIKPSGSPPGTNTPEDIAAHRAGFEFDFRQDVGKMRYIRFVVHETWARTAALHISEISVFGDDRE